MAFQISEQQEMRRAEADLEYARSCPNTLHLFPESVRRPLRNLVDGVCPRRSANRKLHASEFQVCIVKYFDSTPEHVSNCVCVICRNIMARSIFPTQRVDVFCMVLTIYSHYFHNKHYTALSACNGDALHFVYERN
jgi:hypothetical protein